MIYRIDIKNRKISDKHLPNMLCPVCQSQGDFFMQKIRQTFYIFWIPIMRHTADYHSVCPCCGQKYSFTEKEYRAICNASEYEAPKMFYQTAYSFIEDQNKRNSKYIQRSPKSCVVAAILSLFLGLFGAQNLYLGHFRRTILALAVDIVSIMFFLVSLSNPAFLFVSVALLAFNVYWGLGDAIRIAAGRAKDRNGLYVMTQRQYERRCNTEKR